MFSCDYDPELQELMNTSGSKSSQESEESKPENDNIEVSETVDEETEGSLYISGAQRINYQRMNSDVPDVQPFEAGYETMIDNVKIPTIVAIKPEQDQIGLAQQSDRSHLGKTHHLAEEPETDKEDAVNELLQLYSEIQAKRANIIAFEKAVNSPDKDLSPGRPEESLRHTISSKLNLKFLRENSPSPDKLHDKKNLFVLKRNPTGEEHLDLRRSRNASTEGIRRHKVSSQRNIDDFPQPANLKFTHAATIILEEPESHKSPRSGNNLRTSTRIYREKSPAPPGGASATKPRRASGVPNPLLFQSSTKDVNQYTRRKKRLHDIVKLESRVTYPNPQKQKNFDFKLSNILPENPDERSLISFDKFDTKLKYFSKTSFKSSIILTVTAKPNLPGLHFGIQESRTSIHQSQSQSRTASSIYCSSLLREVQT